jgi:hypothetical protein
MSTPSAAYILCCSSSTPALTCLLLPLLPFHTRLSGSMALYTLPLSLGIGKNPTPMCGSLRLHFTATSRRLLSSLLLVTAITRLSRLRRGDGTVSCVHGESSTLITAGSRSNMKLYVDREDELDSPEDTLQSTGRTLLENPGGGNFVM